MAPQDQGYLPPPAPYTPSTDPMCHWPDRARQFNEWFYTALSAPSSYPGPAIA